MKPRISFDWKQVKADGSDLVMGYRYGLIEVGRTLHKVYLHDGIGRDDLFSIRPQDIVIDGATGVRSVLSANCLIRE